MEKTIGVLGAGGWGTAIAKVLADKGFPVDIWSYEEDTAEEINEHHTNSRYLEGVLLPEQVHAETDIGRTTRGKDYLFVAIPSLFILKSVKKILKVPDIAEGKPVIAVLTKGFIQYKDEPRLIIDFLEEMLPACYKNNLVYISGPSHAEEVSRGKMTGLISASQNGKNAIIFRELLNSSFLMVFPSLDVIGVQVCAAVKNVIAIAFGMLDALKELYKAFGDNTESLLLAAGLNEIQTLGIAMGSTHPETFTSIAGVGDLDVTCRSVFGRNRRFGKEIILDKIISRFKNLDDLIKNLSDIGYLPEGAAAAKYSYELGRKYGLKLPVVNGVYSILNRETNPFKAIETIIKNITGATTRQIFCKE